MQKNSTIKIDKDTANNIYKTVSKNITENSLVFYTIGNGVELCDITYTYNIVNQQNTTMVITPKKRDGVLYLCLESECGSEIDVNDIGCEFTLTDI